MFSSQASLGVSYLAFSTIIEPNKPNNEKITFVIV